MPDDLPESVALGCDLETAWRLFTLLEALDWQWTITEILEQPEALLNAVVTIKALAQRLERVAQAENEGRA